MARGGSTTSRTTSTTGTSRSRSKAAQAAEQAADTMVEDATQINGQPGEDAAADEFHEAVQAAEADEAANTESTNEVEETATMSTDTVEAPASDTTEATPEAVTAETAATEATPEEQAAEAAKAAENAENEAKVEAFKSAVAEALKERDAETGHLAEVQNVAVQTAYRELTNAKQKKSAKVHLHDCLKDAVNSSDIILGMAVMNLTNLINSTSTPKPTATPKAVDPSQAFIDSLATLHLAYTLRRADVPAGVDADAAFAKVDEKVEALSEKADEYYAWITGKPEERGDEPEVDAIIKRAIKAMQGRSTVIKASSGTPRAATGGPRRNVRTHISQAFGDRPVGSMMKVAEIANAHTAEYPNGDCSPGAVSAALKSEKGVEGYERTTDDNGNLAARKTA
jgi:hypothetical protein